MLIDWFTVGAQGLNFLILVWLMKRFLYKPVIHAIDAREKRIAKELSDADKQMAEAQQERDLYRKKNEDFEQQRSSLLSQATDEANAERQRLLDDARMAADSLSAKRQESLVNEARNLNQSITLRAQVEVFAIARKALADLAATSLEALVVEGFHRRLLELNDEAKSVLAKAIQHAPGVNLVRSAFELSTDQQAAIQTSINETFAADVSIRFETAPELISGIEFASNGQKVNWSIAGYLSALEKGVGELLKPAPKAEVVAMAD